MSERLLFTTVEDHNAGHVIGYIIGMLYMFGFIYYIYKKYLYVIFEDLLSLLDIKFQDNENEEIYRPILYSLLFALHFLILCFFTTFSSQSTLGVAAIIGSDAFNVLLILGLILIKYPQSQHGTLDPWITLRDSLLYICSLVIMTACLITNWLELGTSLILLGFYILDLFVIGLNEEIKEKIMDWLNITNDDNEFSSSQHLEYKKRRFSITQLRQANYINRQDQNLQKRLNRMEALLVLRYQGDQKKKIFRGKFMGAVYTILFAIKNQAKDEKQKRSDFYNNLYKPKNRQAQSEDDKKQNEQEQDQDDQPLMHKSESNPMESVNQNQEKEKSHNPHAVEHIDKDEGPNLRMPEGTLNRIVWVIFFPVHLILYALPNYIENTVPKKLVLCFFLNICLLCGCFFLLDWWAWEFSIATGIPIQIIGILVFGSFLSIQFVQYSLSVAKIDCKMEFAQAYYQMAICKTCFCTSLPWLLRVIVELDIDPVTSVAYQPAFAIAIAVLGGLVLLFLFLCLLKRFILTSDDGLKLLVLFAGFILASTIIIALNILS